MRVKESRSKQQARNNEVIEKSVNEQVTESFLSKIISLGIESYMEIIEQEITSKCGEYYKHLTNRKFTRWSFTETPVIMGGRKLKIRHKRVRNLQSNTEEPLSTINAFKETELLSLRQFEQMIIGVATRKYRRSLETDAEGMTTAADSKSTVSRNFIAMTQARLDAWRNEPITEEYPILMLDGIVLSETTVLVAMGINKVGEKKALGVWEGSSENSRTCIDLLQSLIERGLDQSKVKLAVIDGSKSLRKALRDVFGNILIQRCQVHKKRNVTDYLPKEKRAGITRAMNEAYSSGSYEIAKKLLVNLAARLDKDYPQAARSLREGLDETLTLLRLKAHKSISKSLSTTNLIENLNSGIKNITRRVKRWRNSDMVVRWVCTGILESEKNFRKINGYSYLPQLLSNIESMKEIILDSVDGAA